jgi:hypothetical protein
MADIDSLNESHFPNGFDRWLGGYVGPATTAEAIKALSDHSGEWVIGLHAPDGELLWVKNGWDWGYVEDEDRALFVIAGTEQGSGNPAVFVDAPIALSFAKGTELIGECSLYAGGLVFKLAFGDYADHMLTVLLWHSMWHKTDSGDIAPGFGSFTASMERVESDEEAEDG